MAVYSDAVVVHRMMVLSIPPMDTRELFPSDVNLTLET